jgi:Fur family ferric uptake transcriptional regulator
MKKELTYFPTWTQGREGYAERIKQYFNEVHETKGLRLTKQKKRILEYLLRADRHLGLGEIHQALKGSGIGFMTVFRVVKLLEECQLVTRLVTERGEPRYEINYERPHHDHLVCIECGTIQEIRWPQIERIQIKECQKLGFHPTIHRHEVFGRCRDCYEKRSGGLNVKEG